MAKATLIIEDAEAEGCVNIHWAFEPNLDDSSPAHSLMARVLGVTDQMIKAEAGQNITEGILQHAQNADSTGG